MEKRTEFTPKRLVTVREAAELLSVSGRWIYNRLADGTIPLIKIQGASRIAVTDLEKLVERCRR